MAEANIIKTPDMGAVNAIDFVNKFGYSINNLKKALGVVDITKVKEGDTFKTSKYVVTMAAGDGVVAEGDTIPLSHVKKIPDQEYKLGFKKYRKAVTMEEVQRVGYDQASLESDREVLKEIHKGVRRNFYTFLGTAPTDLGSVKDLQEFYGKAWGKVKTIFDDENAEVVVFISYDDAGAYLGKASIENGQSVGFGLTLVANFVGVTVIADASVPAGTFYATAKGNLRLLAVDPQGEVKKMWGSLPYFSDELGLIGYVKNANTTNGSEEALIFLGIYLFAEVTSGVVKGTLAPTV